jgi:hypothetical protein
MQNTSDTYKKEKEEIIKKVDELDKKIWESTTKYYRNWFQTLFKTTVSKVAMREEDTLVSKSLDN